MGATLPGRRSAGVDEAACARPPCRQRATRSDERRCDMDPPIARPSDAREAGGSAAWRPPAIKFLRGPRLGGTRYHAVAWVRRLLWSWPDGTQTRTTQAQESAAAAARRRQRDHPLRRLRRRLDE